MSILSIFFTESSFCHLLLCVFFFLRVLLRAAQHSLGPASPKQRFYLPETLLR